MGHGALAAALGRRSGAALDIGPFVDLAADESSPYEATYDGTPRGKRGPIGNPSGADASSSVGFIASSLPSDNARSHRRPALSLLRLKTGAKVKSLSLAIGAAALSASAVAHTPWSHYSSEKVVISYQLPSAWQVQDEHTLEKIGYLWAPYPAYTLIAGGEPATLAGVPNPPSDYVLSETPSPWFMVLVETAASPAPSPEKAYELGPEGEVTLQEGQGLDPSVVSLTQPIDVGSGVFRGSEDRSEVIVPGAGDIELDEVVYTKGHTAWIAISGCTVACYNAHAVTMSTVIDTVKVGTAAWAKRDGDLRAPRRHSARPTRSRQ
jgi:hypothetical protein